MGEQDIPDAHPPMELVNFVVEAIGQFFEVKNIARVEKAVRNGIAEGATTADAGVYAATGKLLSDEGGILKLMEFFGGYLSSYFLSLVVENTFDVPVDNAAFAKLGGKGGRKAVARAITDKMVEGLTGGSKSVEASAQPAANYLNVVFGQVFESWAVGEAIEVLTAAFPKIDKIEHIADLGDKLVNAMGISDSSSRVLRPYIDNLVVEPLRRHIAQTYRPALLSEAAAVRQFLRGTWSKEKTLAELALQGWSEDRAQAFVADGLKPISLDDTLQLVRHGLNDRSLAIENLRMQGYDETAANLVIVAAETRRFDATNDNSLAALTRAYVNRDITDSMLSNFLSAIIVDEAERGGFEVAARTQREMNIRHLSASEVIECVELGILTTAFYREWLEREGYPPDEALALEIRLRVKIDKETDVKKAREQAEADRAAAQQKRDDAAAQRAADVEAERRLHARGSLADLARAVVRGLIPIGRYQEVLTADYDADTVQILANLVEGDRVAYVEQQQRAADAAARAKIRNIDVGTLEQAVLNDVLTVQEFRGRLVALGFPAADAAILTSTLEARKKDLDDARTKRAQAELAAKSRSIDLGRLERLVRAGARTLGDYTAQLAALGYDEGSQAAMRELLQLEINADAAARKIRDDAAAAGAVKDLTLEQARRGVLLGTLTEDQFQSYIVKAGYTSDAQLVLLAELRRDVADAEAARQKRSAGGAAESGVSLSLSRVSNAARLGLLPPATYQARLARAGYSADDIAIEMGLLATEIADVQASRARRDELAAAADQPKAITIAQVERAVRAGTATIADYRGALAAAYAPADVELLVSTLEAELAGLQDAAARRTTIDGELAARTLSLGQLEAGVLAGKVTLDAYVQQLGSWGYGSDDADLLASLLFDKLSRTTAGGAHG